MPPSRTPLDFPSLAHTGSFPAASPAAVTLVTDDGVTLGGTRWLASGESRGVVLIAPAAGRRHRCYGAFAEYLSERGFEVLCWDWRGVGDSRPDASLRDPRLTLRAWGEQDLAAAIAWAGRRTSTGHIALVGHEFGGLALGLAPNAHLVDRAVFVDAAHGWIGHLPPPWRLRYALGYGLMVPLAAAVLGRWPLSWAGRGEDLPAGVVRQWARWSRRRRHLATWEGHAAIDIPILSYSFGDRPLATRAACEALHDEYRSATVRHEYHPRVGLGRFGFFEPGHVPSLWAELAAFLQE